MPSNHLILCHPLLLLPSIFLSIRVFSNELALRIMWPKYWSFSISLSMNIQDWFLLGLTGLISLQLEKWKWSRSVMSVSLRPHGLQHTRLPCPSPSPGACSNSCPLSRRCHPTTSSSVAPSPPAFNLSQHEGLFQWVGFSHQVAKVFELQLQHQSFQWIFRIDYL